VEPAEYGLAGLGWVAALARLDGRGVEARPELSRVGVDRTQLPGWTDEAVGVTISLLLLPAARLGKMLAGVSTPRVPRIYPLCTTTGWSGWPPYAVHERTFCVPSLYLRQRWVVREQLCPGGVRPLVALTSIWPRLGVARRGEGSIVAPCDCRPAMPAVRRGPGLLSGLPGAGVVAAAGVPAAAIGSRCCRLRSAIGWGTG